MDGNRACLPGAGEQLSLAIVPGLPGQLAGEMKSTTAAKKRYSLVATQESLKMMTRVFCVCFCEWAVLTANLVWEKKKKKGQAVGQMNANENAEIP